MKDGIILVRIEWKDMFRYSIALGSSSARPKGSFLVKGDSTGCKFLFREALIKFPRKANKNTYRPYFTGIDS
jgi:hypothetical protein